MDGGLIARVSWTRWSVQRSQPLTLHNPKHTHTHHCTHTHQQALNVTWPTPQYRGVNLGGWLVLESWVRALHYVLGVVE